jgi:hypothetical protein
MFVLPLCVACGPGQSARSPGPERPRDPGPSGPAHDSAQPGAPAASTSDPALSLSHAECETLFDHFMNVAVRAHAGTVTPELQPTPEQVAEIRADMKPAFLTACLEFDRATYDCALEAELEDQLARCAATQRGQSRGDSGAQ